MSGERLPTDIFLSTYSRSTLVTKKTFQWLPKKSIIKERQFYIVFKKLKSCPNGRGRKIFRSILNVKHR